MATVFKLQPNPTFKVDVSIPRAGEQEDGVLTLTFKHMKSSKFDELRDKLREALENVVAGGEPSIGPMVDNIMEIAEGWALKDEFNRENVAELLENYPRAFGAITDAYARELLAFREKN